MKKTLLLLWLFIFIMLVGCQHQHTWKEATCTEPRTCTTCGETEGAPLGHMWVDATCKEPKHCSVCGEKDGFTVAHKWMDATCTVPKTCSFCGETQGEALGHDTPKLSCTEDDDCTRCGEHFEALGHDWMEASCVSPKTCRRCELTDGEPLGHDPGETQKEFITNATCTEDGIYKMLVRCNRCNCVLEESDEYIEEALGHDPGEVKIEIIKEATCTEAGEYYKVVYCNRCQEELSREYFEEEALGHVLINGVCDRCGDIVFEGYGDEVFSNVNVPYGIYRIVMRYEGASNFIVVAYKANGDRLSSLANEIGSYEGSAILVDNIDGGLIEVKASGSWELLFEAIPDGGTSNLAGYGDWVSPWFTLDTGALVVSMTNDGASNFIVVLYDEKGNRYSSLANEIGPYSGSTVFNRGQAGMKYCIEVSSSGNWTVDFGLADRITTNTNDE